MKLTPNAYAIGPGLHDWDREDWETQDNAHDQQEEACKADFILWKRFAYCDVSVYDKESAKKDIERKMSSALELIFDGNKEADHFHYALFMAYCSNDHIEKLREMIGNFLLKSFRHEWVSN